MQTDGLDPLTVGFEGSGSDRAHSTKAVYQAAFRTMEKFALMRRQTKGAKFRLHALQTRSQMAALC